MIHLFIQLALLSLIPLSVSDLSREETSCQCGDRSASVPKHAKNVRLADIDIIGAIGDSDSAAFAANSNGLLDYMNEYWGVSFATGTDEDWTTNPTLANLLKRCNPSLLGGSTGVDSAVIPSGEGHGFNVAVSGDWAQGAPSQAKELVKRIKKVQDYRKKWKLLTVQLGGNDVCSYGCGADKAQASPKAYTKNMKKMLKILSKALPKSIILLLDPIDFPKYQNITGRDLQCDFFLKFSCSCLFDGDIAENTIKMNKLISNYKKANKKLASQFSKKNFVVEAVPALTGLPPQIEGSTEVDKSALTFDCFHYTAKTEGMMGTNVWNNLVESHKKRTSVYGSDLTPKCPSEKQAISFSKFSKK